MAVGDGPFRGLGVMVPVHDMHGINIFAVEAGIADSPDGIEVARALRRAVMARVQETVGRSQVLSPFFSGHEPEGSPAQSERDPHVAFAFDPVRSRLLIVAPHVLERRSPTAEERRHLAVLDQALEGLDDLRAGSAGRLRLRREQIDPEADALTGASRTWETVTPYTVTRHGKKVSAADVLVADVVRECRRRGLPAPAEVTALETRGMPGVGLVGRARLVFAVAVRGPILLGRSRYLGGGLFCGTNRTSGGDPGDL